MRVLILSPEEPPQGLLHALVALDIAPVVVRHGGESATDGAIQYIRVATRGDAASPADLRWSRKALRGAVRDAAPALLHLVGDPWTPTAEAGAAAAKKLGLPYVLVGTSSHGGPKGLTAKWQADRVRDGAAALAGIARPALERLVAVNSTNPTAVIPLAGIPVPLSAERGEAAPPLRLAVVGRVVRERGLDLLLSSLAETFGDWRLRIAGTGPMQEELEAQAQRLGLSSRIEWLGALPRESLPQLWANTDALVVPSRSTPEWVEPTGSLVLDAMAHGVPAIVSRSGALPDVVAEAGLVIAEEDEAALTRALRALVNEPALCRTLGALARARVAEVYSDQAVAQRLATFWRQVLAAKR